jgi:CubicO group peptidase (beta-lactamase class C family)
MGLITFGNPYAVGDLPDARFHLLAWQGSDLQLRNVAPALFGASEIAGRLPIEIPSSFGINRGLSIPQTTVRFGPPESAGLSSDSLFKIDTIMHDAIFDSTFPGGVVTVVKDGVVAYQKGFGYETYDKHNPVNKSDIYDLASLTKVAATTPAMMKLIDEGKINLDDKVSTYFPEFNRGKKQDITIRHLLLHTSGLPAYRVYVDKLQSRSKIVEAIKNEPLINDPGETYEYSDLGFILMGEIVEKVTGKRLDRYMRDTFFAPMGMNSTYFNPRDVGQRISNRIPPTEIDTVYRQKTIRAEVHDERAYYMDGVAGHAGLFSSGSDLAAYTQMLLNGGTYGGQQYLSPAIIKTFTRKQSEKVNRGLGFDLKDKDSSSAGSLTSKKTFGHTGFTGTSFWIDPERNLSIIILTNRVYPYRSYGQNISKIRAAVADAVINSVID